VIGAAGAARTSVKENAGDGAQERVDRGTAVCRQKTSGPAGVRPCYMPNVGIVTPQGRFQTLEQLINHQCLDFTAQSRPNRSCESLQHSRGCCPQSRRGISAVGNPSTGCEAEQRRNNRNACITGRGAHQNSGSNANATLIYSKTQDDLKAYTHIP